MNQSEFDQFADEYYEQHKTNIAITGESPEFFAEYKIRELKNIAHARGISVERIFDFGSGIGNSVPHFRSHFSEGEVTCADVSTRSLELSRKRFPGPEKYLEIPSDRIPAAENSFDATFSACVFHHIPHEEHVGWLRELHRITRKGGLITIFEHNTLNPLTVRAVNTCPFDINAKLIHASHFSRRLRDAGWSDVQVRYHIFFPSPLAKLRPLEQYLAWLPLGAQYSVSAQKS
ncbi:class I SAM-dependent methyltransferase [Microvirga sp. 2MCAF38]|uniref:class I SAM-dependent methyltransferase n=1 Tax=Microvirga sp. 2MCAF38 TaxID=3232989 RepID=UPI003F9C331C